MAKKESLIIEYTNLLHRHGGPEASEVKAFLEEHPNDLLWRRAKVLNQMALLKSSLVLSDQAGAIAE